MNRYFRTMQPFYLVLAVLAICLLLPFTALSAAEHDEEHEDDGEVHDQGEHHEHEFHRHHFSIFLGITDGEVEREVHTEEGVHHFTEDNEEGTIGLDYEYRLNKRWGVAGLVEYAGGDFRSWVWAGALVWHAVRELELYAGPGVEHRGGESGEEFLARLGILYGFEVGRLRIAPTFNVDIVGGEETLVYGVLIGRTF